MAAPGARRSRAVAPAFEKLVQLLQSCTTVGEWNIIRRRARPRAPEWRGRCCGGAPARCAVTGDDRLSVACDGAGRARVACGVAGPTAGSSRSARSRRRRCAVGRPRSDSAQVLDCAARDAGTSARVTTPKRCSAHARIDEHPAGYGDWGLWYSCTLARCAVAGWPALRDWLQRLLRVASQADRSGSARCRGGRVAGCEWPSSKAVATKRSRTGAKCSRMKKLRSVRAGGRGASSSGVVTEARRTRRSRCADPSFASEADDGPRGAVFAVAALERARTRGLVGLPGCRESATLRAWAGVTGAHAPITWDRSLCRVRQSVSRSNQRAVDAARDRSAGRIAAGDSNKLIARAFDLSLHTVKRHVAHILDKLDLDSRGQAAAWYRSHFATGSDSASR